MRLWSVFDNNAYRSLSDARFEILRRFERERGVSGLASYWVVIELLSHIADPGDPDFRPAWASLRRLWRHCADDNGRIRWLADSERHVCQTLFGESPSRGSDAESFDLIVRTIANARDPAEWGSLQPALDYLAGHVQEIENQFRDDIWEYVVLAVNPKAGSWQPLQAGSPLRKALMDAFQGEKGRDLCAQMFVRKAADELGRSIDGSELAQKTAIMRAAFPIPIEFYNIILTRILDSGFDLDQGDRRNAVWDIQIAFSASPAARLQGCPVWIVTTDRLFRQAAGRADGGQVVWSLDEYEALVTGPLAEFLAQLSSD